MVATESRRERTIAREAGVRGISFLGGLDVALRFRPADAGTGVVFVRTDLPGSPSVPAHVSHVVPRERRTAIQRGPAVVEMVEHVMAALAGLQIDNCLVDIDGPETPGCDGSSLEFVQALETAGVVEQERRREVVHIDRPITVRNGGATLTAHPGVGRNLVLSYNLDYGDHTPIGRQSLFLDLQPHTFRNDLASSRTFLLAAEARALHQAGIGTRTTEADLLIFGEDGPINNELRYPDECVRHKMLDMVGDLALLGRDIVGHVAAHRSGHQLNAELVRALLEAARVEARPTPPTGPRSLEISEILKILPHRYPFLLLDRITELDGDRVVAVKNVTYNEPFFQGHWPGMPIMPGVLILEAMAQAAGVMIGQKSDCSKKCALIATIDDVKLRRQVVPGDQLLISATCLRSRPRTADVEVQSHVAGHVVAEARMRFVFVDKTPDS